MAQQSGYWRTLRNAVLGQKASAVGALIARVMLNRPVWSARDFEKLGREGYQQNPVVARCVQLVAEGVANIPWAVYQGKGDKKTELEEHPLIEFMRRPNPDQDGISLLAAIVSHYMISGNAYIERTDEDNFERMECYALRPDRMRVVPGETGTPMAYEYMVNGQVRRFDMDVDRGTRPILHLKRFHPVDDWYGMSPLDPSAVAIDVHNGASGWNKALLENSGAPSGAFLYKGNVETGGKMADDQYARTLKMLRQQVEGSENAGRNLLLEGDMDYKTLGFNAEQMQFVDSKNVAAREIAFTLGVPPMLLGIPGDNTYSNYQEARLAFYQETVIPLANMIVRALNHWFARALGKGVCIELNTDDLDALATVRKEQWERIQNSTILSLNEKREALGYEAVDGGDAHYVSAGSLPLGEDATYEGGPEPDEEEDETPPKDKKNVVPMRGRLN